MKHPRQVVKRIRDEQARHFDNEMRLADMMRAANLTAEESDYLLGEMMKHPHFVDNVIPILPEIHQTFERLKKITDKPT